MDLRGADDEQRGERAERAVNDLRSSEASHLRAGAGGARKDHDLRVARNSHPEPPLGDRCERRTAGGLANLALESCLLRLELDDLLLESAQIRRLRDPRGPTPDDACRDQNETEQPERNERPAPEG